MRSALLTLLIVTTNASLADEIKIPVGQQGQASLTLPARGDAKIDVLDRYGLADQEHAPVGKPPITRWDYREFSVYFESNRVINSVAHHQRTTTPQREGQE